MPVLGMIYVGEKINIMKDDVTKGYAHAARMGSNWVVTQLRPSGRETRTVLPKLPICTNSSHVVVPQQVIVDKS